MVSSGINAEYMGVFCRQCLGSHLSQCRMQCVLLLCLLSPALAQIFRLPDADSCEKRVIHTRKFGKAYHFSWLEAGPRTKWDWEGARNYCRKFCMDSISIETKEESDWVTDLIRKEDLHYIWTGGRKCNFKGCDRKDLQPLIQKGWYWAPTGKRIRPPENVATVTGPTQEG
eukprot:TRINITY_DN13039_c0_g1_i1.p1 TRINITY_DN13039_c0_g1~~TRINITY_DN13039_c0_g1_i1.p1  ORF type:complete len:171 (-),score=56.33 TRINITY_DN13039_c0_g1_i1:278-790(-)